MSETVIRILLALLMFVGAVGSIVPLLPGKPIAFAALLIAKFMSVTHMSWGWVVFFGVLMVAGLILDYLVPIYITKRLGGSKYGVWGLIAGLIVGIIFSPFGYFSLILAPFLGAFAGEMIHDRNDKGKAVKAASGSILGFFLTAGYGIALCLSMMAVFLWKK